MSDNIFNFPKGSRVETSSTQNEEVKHVRDNLRKHLEESPENLRSLLYITVDDTGNATVGYGGEFAATDIIGIIETIKLELALRSLLLNRE